jgi:hypothetical protein
VEPPGAGVRGPRLGVLDRQVCDRGQTARWSEAGDPFLIRYPKKVQFCPDPLRPVVVTRAAQGRRVEDEGGWRGAESNRGRRFVRRRTLTRPGEEALI